MAVLAGQKTPIPLAVGGLPSPESIFTIHCVIEIVRRARCQPKAVPLNTLDDARGLAGASPSEPVIPFFDTPDIHARDALLASEVPIIMVDGDFADTARFCMVARSLDALQAARFVSQSFSCLDPLRHYHQVRTVTLDRTSALADWIDEVASWLELHPSSWELARQQMLADYAAWPTVDSAIHGLVQFANPTSADWKSIPAAAGQMFDNFGLSYRAGAINSLCWPAECLLEPREGGNQIADQIDLTGPARLLTFGPFMHLPPGRWRARYQFEANEHPVGNLMEFDVVHGGNILVSRTALVDSAGRFGVDCIFDIEEARQPVENRAILIEGAIGGQIRPQGVWLTREQ